MLLSKSKFPHVVYSTTVSYPCTVVMLHDQTLETWRVLNTGTRSIHLRKLPAWFSRAQLLSRDTPPMWTLVGVRYCGWGTLVRGRLDNRRTSRNRRKRLLDVRTPNQVVCGNSHIYQCFGFVINFGVAWLMCMTTSTAVAWLNHYHTISVGSQ